MRYVTGSRPRAAAEIGVHHVAHDGPGADDRHLRPRGRRSARGACAAASPSARGSRPGRRRRCRRCCSMRVDRRVVGRQMGEVHVAARARGSSAIASWSSDIMPSPRRSTLTMPRSAQSSLSHWTTTRPGIVAGSSGTTSSRRPGAITMPPECWPRWRGRSWMPRPERGEELHARVARDRSRPRARCASEAVAGIRVARSRVTSCAQPVDRARREAERLADLARRAAAAVGDDVGGHGRAAARRSARRRTG